VRIGVFCPNWVGDAVMSIPFFNQLKQYNPESIIFAISKSWVAPIFYNHPAVDEIISFEKKDISSLRATKHSGLSLRSLDLDIFYLLSDSYRSAYIAKNSETSLRIGYQGQGRTRLLTKALIRPKEKIHRSNLYMNLLGGVKDLNISKNHSGIIITDEEKKWAKAELNKLKIDDPIAFFPFSIASSRSFTKINSLAILEKIDKNILIFGGKRDQFNSDLIKAESQNSKIYSLAGKYDLRQSMALISKCKGSIASDSGLGHISGNLGIPTVTLFGAGDSQITRPLGKRTSFIDKKVHCSPCLKNKCNNNKQPLLCLDQIKPEDPWEKLSKI